MTGTVQVGEPTTTTSTGTTGTGTGGTGTGGTGGGSGGSGGTTTGGSTPPTMTMPMDMPMPSTSTPQKSARSPIVGSARTAIKVAGLRGGGKVDGSIEVSRAGKGGHAVITVLASSAALGSGHGKQAVTLGRIRLNRRRAGAVAFKLTLKTVARHALTTHRRLSVSVQITVAASGAQTVTVSRSLILRP